MTYYCNDRPVRKGWIMSKRINAGFMAAIIVIASTSAGLTSAQGRMRSRPVMIEGGSDLDPCSAGVIKGLKHDGDGFLSVRNGPGGQYQERDKLYNGTLVAICDSGGDWLGVVYEKPRGQDCGLDTTWVRILPYTGPCRFGWVHRQWVELYAG